MRDRISTAEYLRKKLGLRPLWEPDDEYIVVAWAATVCLFAAGVVILIAIF